MNKSMEDRIAATIGIILMVLLACIICYVAGRKSASGQETPKWAVSLSTLTRPIPQDWSEIELAFKAVEERKANEAEQERLRRVSESARADLSQKQGNQPLGESSGYVASGDSNPYYGGPRFVSRQFVYDLAAKYAYCGWDPAIMTHIVCDHETISIDTMAYNPGGPYYGLLQCSTDGSVDPPEQMFNPDFCFQIGVQKFVGAGGYSPWGH